MQPFRISGTVPVYDSIIRRIQIVGDHAQGCLNLVLRRSVLSDPVQFLALGGKPAHIQEPCGQQLPEQSHKKKGDDTIPGVRAAGRTHQHGGLDLEQVGQRQQVGKTAHHKGHGHQGECLPRKGKGRAANHTRHACCHAHVSRNAHKGRARPGTGQNHGQLARRHQDELPKGHGGQHAMGVGIDRHEGKPLDNNQGQHGRAHKDGAGFSGTPDHPADRMVPEGKTEHVNRPKDGRWH